jgi:hypothetical protein
MTTKNTSNMNRPRNGEIERKLQENIPISPHELLVEPNEVPSKLIPFSMTRTAFWPIFGLSAFLDTEAEAPFLVENRRT